MAKFQINPFRFGEIVQKERFCTRAELMKQLREIVESGRNAAIMGERRTGKSSAIIEAVRRKRGAKLIYVDFLGTKNIADAITRIVEAITTAEATDKTFIEKVSSTLGALRPVIEFDPLTGSPSMSIGHSGAKISASSIHAVFDFIEVIDAGKGRIVVAFDEFQDIRLLDGGENLLAEMRSRIQRQTNIPYLFAGSIRHEMEKIFNDPDSPFFKSVITIEVGPIPSAHFKKFLRKQFALGRRKISNEIFDSIFELVDQSPSDIQQVCHFLWNITDTGEIIEKETVTSALDRILTHEKKGYEAVIFPLTDQQMRCVCALARIGGEHPQGKDFLAESGIRLPSSVKRALERLVNLRIVYGPEKHYKFFDSFFKLWLRWRY